jgi:hypothetical protein
MDLDDLGPTREVRPVEGDEIDLVGERLSEQLAAP